MDLVGMEGYLKLEGKWWQNEEWIALLEDFDKEPTLYEVIHNFIINKVVPCSKCVEISGRFVSRIITVKGKHPDKEEYEYARIMLSPTDVAEGVPDAESDLIAEFDYYDLVRILRGEIGFMLPLFQGRGHLLGNITCAIDLRDIIDAANGKEVVDRPNCWPRGHP